MQRIVDFVDYLEEWQQLAEEKGTAFIPNSTYSGLRVTLKAAVEVMEFLVEKCGYEFLMTARLNQDALEVIFCYYFLRFPSLSSFKCTI